MTGRHFLFHAVDAPGQADLRRKLRETHRLSLRRPDPTCRCVLGGPLLDDAGEMMGTALVFEAESAAAITAFMADDPYMTAGLFKRTKIRPWRIGLGTIVAEGVDGAIDPRTTGMATMTAEGCG